MTELIAVGTLLYHAIHDEARLSKTLDVLLGSGRPALRELRATRLRRELDADCELLIDLALQIDDGVGV